MSTVPNIKEMFAELIASPSVSSAHPDIDQSNEGVISSLAKWLEDLGFSIDIIQQTDRSLDDGSNGPKKLNLIATLGSGPGGLILAGHTDTVPFNEAKWKSDPFKLTEANDRYFGLGTTDMKGFFPLAIEAIKHFKAEDIKHPLIVLATADEETSMEGAKTLVRLGKPKAPYALIGEPTSLKPIRMHKGILMQSIRVQGQAGHSSDPSLGLNALEVMNDVMSDLIIWRNQLQAQYQNPLFEVPHPTLNLGCIHGGDNPNRICDACELHIDLRPIPGMSLDNILEEMKNRFKLIEAKWQCSIETSPLFDGIPAFETSANAAIVKSAESLTGFTAESVAFGTEAPYLAQLGAETLILGPGQIDLAHQANESIAVDSFDPMIRIIKGLIQQFCL